MNPAVLPAELRRLAPDLAVRLVALLAGLAALVAHALLKDPSRVALILPLHTRLIRAGRRFTRAMRRLADATPSRPARPGRRPGAPPVRLPHQRAWLLAAIGYRAAHFTNRLERMLDEPDTAGLLTTCPQAVRILRPICRMLGVRDTALPARPRRPRARPAPRRELPAPPAPLLPAPSWPAPPRRLAPLCVHMQGWPWFPHPNAKPA